MSAKSQNIVILFAFVKYTLYLCSRITLYCEFDMRACRVFYNNRLAGKLTEYASDHYEFVYDDAYMADPNSSAICFAMPKSQKCYQSEVLFPFFFNLLSEGENRKFQSMYLKLDPHDDFGFLLATAQYDTAGAITVEPFDTEAV